jgi:ABC-2 type transport system permease protein
LLSGIAIVMGAFGSVFNTYSSLYLGKDNDLLLSLPIPVNTIIAARLINVYLLGAMYSATALLPALAVDWIVNGLSAARVICGIGLFLIVTVIVLLLSCVLGWVVAKISVKLKNKSFLTVLIALLFIGAYYFFYFKARDFIADIVAHAGEYGARIRGAARSLYLFGRIGEGDWAAAAICLAVTAALFALMWGVLSRSFLRIATSSGSAEKVRYVEKAVRQKSVFGALLGKELGRFVSSANYMLNCGLSVLFLPAVGVLLLIKGREICDTLAAVLASRPGSVPVLLCVMLFLLSSMADMAAPSVSLEGKSLWIPLSLPVEAKTVLRAKLSMQLLLSVPPMLFAAACAAVIPDVPLAVRLLILALPVVYAVFSAVIGMVLGVRMPLLNWTDEIAPIKQSGAVGIVLFGGWGVSMIVLGLYLLVGYQIGAAPYLAAWTVLFAVGALSLLRWLDTRGSRLFEELY